MVKHLAEIVLDGFNSHYGQKNGVVCIETILRAPDSLVMSVWQFKTLKQCTNAH